MIRELIRALFQAGIPVALTSYLLVWWALRNNYLGTVASIKDIDREIKRLSKAKSEAKKKKKAARKDESALAIVDLHPGADGNDSNPGMNPVHNKWMAFGGGFYGAVALLTYLVVELGEVGDFVAGLESITELFSRIGIELLISFFINSLLNFITAISWPLYWLDRVHSNFVWIWFIAAYAGYYAGVRVALHRAGQN